MRNLFAVLLLMSVPSLALASAKPPEIAGAVKAPKPVGEASLSKLFIHVYDVAFWSDSQSWKRAPYALSIVYDMDFSPDELADRTRKEMANVSDLPPETLTKYADLLRDIYPPVKAGDRITALQKDAGTTVFYHNGKQSGTVKDAGFAAPFFGIWLSPGSSEPDMQKKLIARTE